MSKQLAFRLYFPTYHPKAGQQTYFVEKLFRGFPDYVESPFVTSDRLVPKHQYPGIGSVIDIWELERVKPKFQKIAPGLKWSVGDKFTPYVYLGVPYMSGRILLGPDVEVVKVWDFNWDPYRNVLQINGKDQYNMSTLLRLAENEGLELRDFLDWYIEPIEGQIICWNNEINY